MIKILFLGNRRIAQSAIRILAEDYKSTIAICGVVSDIGFYTDIVLPYFESEAPKFISNAQRNETEIRRLITETEPDYIISIQHIWLISKEIIESVGGHILNLHNAKLPDYKGHNSINHAIVNNDAEYTTTIHWIDEEVDAGDIAYEASVSISEDDTAFSLYQETLKNSELILNELFRDIILGDVKRTPMKKGGRFYGKVSLDDLRDITDIVDANEISRRVRACYFPPYEPAYIIINGKKNYVVPKEAGKVFSLISKLNVHK